MYFKSIREILLIYRLKEISKQQFYLLYFFDRTVLKYIQSDDYIECTLHGVLLLDSGPEKSIYVY